MKQSVISGVLPFTMLDYPNKLSCVVFLAGCNLRCGFCHNPEFVLPQQIQKIKNSFIPFETFFSFLKKRVGFLEGVVVSGGEPTNYFDLIKFIKQIKNFGYCVKLDTNGLSPKILEVLLKENLLDYIAMDIKTSLQRYKILTKCKLDANNIKQSIKIIRNSGIDFEFRTTLIKQEHKKNVLNKIADLLKPNDRYYLQKFRPIHVLDKKYSKFNTFTDEEINKIIKEIFNTKSINAILR